MSPLAGQRWSKEKPTAAGWYWWRLDGVVAVVHITQPHWLSGTEPHKFIMYWYGQQYQLNQVGGEFKGPITPDSFQQGRVAGLREACIAVSQFSSDGVPINADELRIALVQLLGSLAQQAQEGGVR